MKQHLLHRTLVLVSALAVSGGTATAQQTRPAAFPGFGGASNGLVLANNGRPFNSQPLIVDLGNLTGCSVSAFREIVFGTFDPSAGVRRLNVICHKTGTTWGQATGFPVNLPGDPNSPAVGNIDTDPALEIVISYGSTFDFAAGTGGVKAFETDGTVKWTLVPRDVDPADGRPDAVLSTPAIGDVDGDGIAEVAFGALDQHVYLVDGRNGFSKTGWTDGAGAGKFVSDTVFSSPALHDLDGDGRAEVILGIDAQPGSIPGNTLNGGALMVWRWDGANFPGYPKFFDQQIGSPPTIGDITGDGRPEIVHGTGYFWTDANNGPSQGQPARRIYAWQCDGTAAPGWPVTINGESDAEPALADLNGDTQLDVVVTFSLQRAQNTYQMQAFRGNGTALFAAQMPRDFFNGNLSAGSPIVGDVMGGDSTPEILVASNSEIVVFSSTGVQLTDSNGFPPPSPLSFSANMTLGNAAIGDLDGNGVPEVLAISSSPFPNNTNTEIWAWNPTGRTTPPLWGFSRREATRRGVVAGTASCGNPADCVPSTAPTRFHSITPCRAYDSRVGGAGGPLLSGAPRRTIDLRAGCPAVPVGAVSAALNVTAVDATAGGFMTFVMAGCTSPTPTQTIHYQTGIRANNAVLPLSRDGNCRLGAQNSSTPGATVHLIVDVFGYFAP